MKRYSIALQHGRGRIRIETAARDWQAALRAVLSAELAPISAVLSIAELDAMPCP